MTDEQTVLEPGDLQFLQSYFDGILQQRGLDGEDLTARRAATNLAAEIIALYQTGVREPQELSVRLGL